MLSYLSNMCIRVCHNFLVFKVSRHIEGYSFWGIWGRTLAETANRQTMTEAAFFTIGRSRTVGYGKIRPLADYRSRSRLFIFSPKISNLYLICRFIHLQKLKISWKLELQWSMKLKWNLYFFFQEKISFLTLDFSFF